MSWLFRKFDPTDNPALLSSLRHFQLILAFQQLSMEMYNDAFEQAAETFDGGDELLVRGTGTITDLVKADQIMLPAIQDKAGVIDHAIVVHNNAAIPDDPLAQRAAADITRLINVMHQRVQLQYECFRAWIADPALDIGAKLMSLDGLESKSMTTALKSIDRIIKALALDLEGLVTVNVGAFNHVRAWLGDPPIHPADFRARYLLGIQGHRARFFD